MPNPFSRRVSQTSRRASLALLMLSAVSALAGQFHETDGVAINGFDPVAYITERKAVQGDKAYTSVHKGSTFHFTDAANRDAFIANPEKFAPQYGGHCAWCVSENCICGRPANGQFEVLEGRLYLFPDGNKGRSAGTKNAWWMTGGGPARRIPNSDKHWPELKAKLEAQGDNSKGPAPIAGPGGGMNAVP